MPKNATPDQRAAEVAAAQHGLITMSQARGLGLTAKQVEVRRRSGRWVRLGRGVYRIGGVPVTPVQRMLADCLAAADGAVVSHLHAAVAAGLDATAPPKTHLTVGPACSVRTPGVLIHRAALDDAERTVFQGVPATAVPRTLVDCAGMVGPRRLHRLVDSALHRRLLPVGQARILRADLDQRPGRPGASVLRTALDEWVGPITPGSPPEVRLRRQLVEWGFPTPERQVVIVDECGEVVGRADLGWLDRRIGIEYDSPEHHGPLRWGADEARHQAIERLGWRLLRADKLDLRPGEGALRDSLRRAWSMPRATVPIDRASRPL